MAVFDHPRRNLIRASANPMPVIDVAITCRKGPARARRTNTNTRVFVPWPSVRRKYKMSSKKRNPAAENPAYTTPSSTELMLLRRTTTMMRTPIPLNVSSTSGAMNDMASASARRRSPIVKARSVWSAVFVIIDVRVATPPPHRNIASFVVHGSGSQRSIRWRKPTTITRATRDSSVVFTKAVTLEDSGAKP